MGDKVKIGIVGCGNISNTYLKNCQSFRILEVAALADMLPERAQAKAEEFGVPCACGVDELLNDPEIQIVLNLTVPQAHASVTLASLSAGKHVYSEKPLGITYDEGCEIVDLAREKGLRIGCAPDTFLGGGLQTCRKLIDDGWIGQPVAACAFLPGHGPESWHPDPEFFYKPGAGPMFDMGPYYLTALVSLLGPIRRITGSTRISFPERLITSQPHYGKMIQVETPTHVAGVLDFESGAVGTIITSFDIWAANLPRIEIYGSEGSLSVPDPNTFDGPVRVRRAGAEAWSEVPLTHGYITNSRGLGVADMASGLVSGRPHRASGEMAFHVLEVMASFEQSSRTQRHIQIASACVRPTPLPLALRPGELAV